MASSSSSSSSSVQPKYQVFLSFRGEDTRNNFISHLHAALKGKGIDTFIDYQLVRGEEISQALLTAIEESKISIIVLSKNYASSSWCLDELSKILECKKTMGQKVVPIFYHVDPSDVRKQQGSFEEAFAKHQQRFKDGTDKVERWRAALKEVGSLSGYHIKPHLPESTLIAEIVKDISKKLMYKSLCDTKRLVGIDSHIEAIESLLCFDSADVRIIGITGMGGIGKTTIAETVYNLFFDEFDGFCFVNVKEELNGGPGGQVRLREKLFSKILVDENLNLSTSFLPFSILDRLYCKKVFIVLDDVNHSTQLLDLLPEKQCFKPGSRIIVLSRDKQVLQQVVDVMYEVEGMVDDEALHLFCMYAFKQSQPKEDFMELSKKVIHYTKGLPLALRVVGSTLYCKSKHDWEGYLIKLKESSDLEIDEVLKISYDGLSDEVKGIFLDIACFFRWKQRNFVENILDGCYISVTSGISILVDKSLITVLHNMINMHDLVQLMAWNIIRQESKEPGKRSRLWTPKDICHVLKNNTGNESVEGMFLDMSKIGNLCLSPTAFEKMCNLRLLKFYYTNFKCERKVYLSQQGLEYLPNSLSYLHWDDYPSKSLPLSFCPVNLVELRMPNSHVEQLWNGVQDLVKLKKLDLSDSQHLIKIPDLSRATNLESLFLDECRSLVDIPSSIRYLNKLSFLSLSQCQNLVNFPSNIDLRSLTTLILSDCSNVTKFPEISVNLVRLYLDGTAIEEVPSSIDRLSRLSVFNLENCTRLQRLPSNICKLKFLKNRYRNACLKLMSFPEILKTMEMECLKSLCLSYTLIEELPSSIEHLVGLKLLKLDYCEKLKNLPNSIMDLKSLENLSLINCSNFTRLPEIPSNLKSLNLSGTAIEQLPSSIVHVSRLENVYLETCTKLRSLPRNIFKLKNLHIFNVCGFSKVEVIQELLGTIQVLKIRPSCGTAWSKANQRSLFLDELPDNVENFKSLKYLHLGDCNLFAFPSHLTRISSLTNLDLTRNNFETISASIKQLLNLERLDLSYCRRLQSLPELPPNLQHLNADSCSSLETVSSLFTLGRGRPIKFLFTNCLKLDQNALSHILAETQLWIRHWATKLYCQGSLEVSSLGICLPGNEIPEWFSCQNKGSSVTTMLPLYDFLCFALCVVVALEDYDKGVPVIVYCSYNFKCNYGDHHVDFFQFCRLDSCETSTGSDYMFLGNTKTHLHHKCASEASFKFFVFHYECKVKKCGVRILYPQNDQIIYEDYGSDFPYAKNTEESNSIMLYQPSSSSDPTGLSLSCGVNNQDFGEPTVEDGTIIRRCRSDHCYHEAEPSGNFDPSRDTIMIQPSSPYDSKWLSLNCGVIDQGFGEPMQEDGAIIKRCYDDNHNNEAEPSGNFSSNENCTLPITIHQLLPCQPSKSGSGSGSDSSDLPYAKDAEESNSIMIYQPSSSSDPTWLSLRCGVNNQDFGEPVVEDGTIIKGCRSDYCHDEAEPSGSFGPGRDTILIQPSSPYDSTWLSLNCGVIDQGFGELMQEDGTIIKRRRDDHHNNEAEPSRNFNSEQEEDEPRPKRLKRIIMTNRTLLFKSKVVRRRKKSPCINQPTITSESSVSSEEEEDKPHPKRLKRIIMTNRTLLFKSKVVRRRRTKSPWINQPTLISKSRVRGLVLETSPSEQSK